MTFTLRPATPSDEAFLYSLHIVTMRESVSATWGWDGESQKQRFATSFAPERTSVILVSGVCAGMIEIDPGPSELFIRNLKILPQFQGAGLGTEILRRVISSAANDGLSVRLQVLRANTRARQLYVRLGFKESGRTATHIQMGLLAN